MQRLVVGLVLAGFAVLNNGCAPSTKSAAHKLSGVWEIRYQDAVGQSYLNILELHEDGSYATYMQDATPSDEGAYTFGKHTITFESAADQRLSREVSFTRPDTKTLRITIDEPFPVTADWRRSELRPLFDTVKIAGRHIPRDLSGLVKSALSTQALPWREDAWPSWLYVAATPAGHANLTLTFYSPSSGDMLRLDISKYDIRRKENDGSRFFHDPLPPQFVELEDVLRKAAADGVTGPLNRAEMRIFGAAGAAWMIFPNGPKGATYSAQTGAKIEGDVTGYIAQYEKDWEALSAIWSEAMRKYEQSPDKNDPFKQDEYKSTAQRECEARIDADWNFGRCQVR